MTEKNVWLITGAGRGLGVDIAKAALSAGHAVVATGRDAAKVAAAVSDHESLQAIKLDVTRGQLLCRLLRGVEPPNKSAINSTRCCSPR